MPRVTQHHRSNASSIEISGGESDSSSSDDIRASAKGSYSEGMKAPSTEASHTAEAARQPDAATSLCPEPVRLLIGVFSTLAAVAGGATAIVGGNALNSPSDPQAGLHRIMLGSGLAALGIGASIAMAAFGRVERFAAPATPA